MSKGTSATTTKSVQRARKNLTKFLKTLDTVPREIMEEEAKKIYLDEVASAPYQTGKLESKIYCRVSTNKRAPGIVTGASAKSPEGYDYAGIQHERADFNHPVKGTAFYIRDPFNRGVRRIRRKMRQRIQYKNEAK